MNQSSNPLDRLFRKKLQDRPVEMDMAHWQAAADRLDSEPKKKHRGFLWFGGITLLAVMVAGIFLWGKSDSNVLITDQEAAAAASTDYYKIKDPAQSNDNLEIITNQSEVSTNSLNSPDLINTEKTETLANFESGNLTQQKDQLATKINETSARNALSKNGTASVGLQDRNINSSQDINNLVETEFGQTEVELNSAERQVLQSVDYENNSPGNSLDNAGQVIDQVNAINQDINSDSKQVGLSLLEDRPASWITSKIERLKLLPERNLKIEDSPYNMEILASVVDEEFSPQFKMGFYLEGMLNAFNASQDEFGGFRLGLLGQYYFSSKVALQFEPGYHQQTGMDFYSKLRQDNIYDFGLNTETFAMLAETAHFLSLPISIKYQVKKHGFEGGVDLNYLLGVQGDVQEVTLMNVTDPNDLTRNAKVNEVVESLNAGWLDMAPFASLTNRFFVGYNYLVNRGFTVGARAYYQPNPLLENAPSTLIEPNHTKLLIGLQAKFIIE